ncbi:DUF6221 family protein [Streptomyces massasporeus]|uniref:DUF6221 family protein n=1 Tax=Streptomyces massasporeus TaxID=67324 RepID=UPI0038301182
MIAADLIQFLRERIAEDERLARDAAQRAAAQLAISDRKDDMHEPPYDGTRWGYDYGLLTVGERIASRHRFTEIADCGAMGFALTPHIAQHDPARTLAEVAAKRAIIRQWEYWEAKGKRGPWTVACRLLALPYANHPDYLEEWRP